MKVNMGQEHERRHEWFRLVLDIEVFQYTCDNGNI